MLFAEFELLRKRHGRIYRQNPATNTPLCRITPTQGGIFKRKQRCFDIMPLVSQ